MSRASQWVADRVGAGRLRERLSARQVPAGNVTSYLGSTVVFLFLLEVASGILLLLPYRPDPDGAHASIVVIVGQVPYGSLVRGVHAWTSQMFVAALLLHLLLILVLRRYRPPRELVWLTGLLLLAMGVGLAFTGTILPWSQSAYLQAAVSSEMAGQTPLLGNWLKELLRGGSQVDGWTLHHAFGFHTGVLPAVTTLIIATHLWLVNRKPSPAFDAPTPPATIPVYPDFLLRMVALWTLALIIVISLATFVWVPIGVPADPTATVLNATPPWYFLFLHQILKAAPPLLLGVPSAKFIIGVLMFIGIAAALLPFVDRRGSRATMYAALVFLVLYVVLTGYALA